MLFWICNFLVLPAEGRFVSQSPFAPSVRIQHEVQPSCSVLVRKTEVLFCGNFLWNYIRIFLEQNLKNLKLYGILLATLDLAKNLTPEHIPFVFLNFREIAIGSFLSVHFSSVSIIFEYLRSFGHCLPVKTPKWCTLLWQRHEKVVFC